MAAVHSLLSIFGAIDESVVQADDPAWSAIVEQYLPGTTGINQRGWFRDIKRLITTLAPNPEQVEFPDVESALAELDSAAVAISGFQPETQVSSSMRIQAPPPAPADDRSPIVAGGEPPPLPPPLTKTNVAQTLYVIATLRKLRQAATARGIAFPVFPDDAGFDVYGLVGMPDVRHTDGSPIETRTDAVRLARIQALTDLLDSADFSGFKSWQALMAGAATDNTTLGAPLVTADFAAIPVVIADGKMTMKIANSDDEYSTAGANVTQIDGNWCAVLFTDSCRKRPGLTLTGLKAIVDPRNWPSLSAFFCQMDRMAPDAGGASQLLEHVSTDKTLYQMKTALKFWKEDFGTVLKGDTDGGILNYELADQRDGTGDSRLVLVDSGYIHMKPKVFDDGATGICIKTSKMVAIQGASVTATAVFINMLGWGSMSDAMLFDNALSPGADGVKLGFWEWEKSPETAGQQSKGPATAKPADTTPPIPLPLVAPGNLLSQAVQTWAKYVEEGATTASGLVNKWYRGQLTAQDLVDASSKFGAEIASEPWRNLAATQLRSPTTGTKPGDVSGGGSS